MANPSKAKGTAAESAVVRYLNANGWPNAERRALNGNTDKGDVAGLPCVIEVKACKQLALAAWVDEAVVEARNADAPFGVVWHKRRGTTDPSEWYVTMCGADFLSMLRDVAYVDAHA